MSDENKTSLWLQLAVAGVIIALAIKFIDPLHPVEEEQPPIPLSVEFTGQIQHGLLSSSEFVFRIWHNYPGTLHAGTLHVMVRGEHVNGGEPKTEIFSFDSWPPNEENARSFRFKIDKVAPLRVGMQVVAEECDALFTRDWTGTGWDKTK